MRSNFWGKKRPTPYWMVVVLLVFSGCGCSEKGNGADKIDAGIDASFLDAGDGGGVDADATPEPPDGTIQHDFCDKAFFKLPIDGPTQATYHLAIWQDKIVYSVTTPGDITKKDVYLMDLSTCIEKQISYSGKGAGAAVDDARVIWRDSRNRSEDPYHCSDHYIYNLASGLESQLNEDPKCVGIPRLYGDWLSYRQAESTSSDRTDLILTQLGSGEEEIIVPGTWLPISPDLSEQYLVFGAQSEDSTSIGRDAYYYDLQEETLHRIPESSDVFCEGVTVSGDWLMYGGNYYSMQMPFKVALYNIPEKRHIALSPQEDIIPSIALHGNLAAWTTMIYSGTHYMGPVDMEMYDVNQETRRRLTKTSGHLRAIAMFFPYLVMLQARYYDGNNFKNDFYVAHLVKLGITDAEGNLLAGEGAIEQPD